MRQLLVATLGVALLLGCTPPGANSTAKKSAKAEDKPAIDPKKPIFEAFAEGLAYVANSGEDTLSCYNLKSLEPADVTIKTGHAPGNIARDTQNLLYFPARYLDADTIAKTTPEGGIQDSFRSGSLWAINPMMGNSIQQKGVIGDIDNKPDAVFVAVSQDGQWVAVADQSVNKIVIRQQTSEERKLNREIETGPGPLGLAFSPDAKYLAVACNDPNGTTDPDHLIIYDFLGDNNGPVEIARVEVGDRPSQVAAAPDNVTFYVTVPGSRKVVGVSAATQAKVGEWALNGAPQGILGDATGANYYVTLEDTGKLLRIDPANGTVTNEVEVGGGAYMIAMDTHNGRLWVTNKVDNTVSVVRLGDFQLEKHLKTGQAPTGIAIVLNPFGNPAPQPTIDSAPAEPAQPINVQPQADVPADSLMGGADGAADSLPGAADGSQ